MVDYVFAPDGFGLESEFAECLKILPARRGLAGLPRRCGGRIAVPIGHVYQFSQIAEAHAAMEASQATGKLVVLTEPKWS